jgi:hypothetical protein
MDTNRISATFTLTEQQAVLAAIAIIYEKLSFLVGLTPEQRRSLCRMGDKTRAFVDKAVELATQNTELMPRCLDIDEMRRDLELVESLYPVLLSITQLQELIEDTYLLAGSEAYAAARMAYNSARANGRNAGLNATVDQMGRRFERKSRKTQPDLSQT